MILTMSPGRSSYGDMGVETQLLWKLSYGISRSFIARGKKFSPSVAEGSEHIEHKHRFRFIAFEQVSFGIQHTQLQFRQIPKSAGVAIPSKPDRLHQSLADAYLERISHTSLSDCDIFTSKRSYTLRRVCESNRLASQRVAINTQPTVHQTPIEHPCCVAPRRITLLSVSD